MLPIIATIGGFALGWIRAARRGGTQADRWQYAIAHAFGFGLLGFVAAIVIVWIGLFAESAGG